MESTPASLANHQITAGFGEMVSSDLKINAPVQQAQPAFQETKINKARSSDRKMEQNYQEEPSPAQRRAVFSQGFEEQ